MHPLKKSPEFGTAIVTQAAVLVGEKGSESVLIAQSTTAAAKHHDFQSHTAFRTEGSLGVGRMYSFLLGCLVGVPKGSQSQIAAVSNRKMKIANFAADS